MSDVLKTNVRHRRVSGYRTDVQFFSFYCYWIVVVVVVVVIVVATAVTVVILDMQQKLT